VSRLADRIGWVGLGVAVVGLVALIIGLSLLPSEIAGTVSQIGGSGDAYAGVYVASVPGRSWLVAGTVLVGVAVVLVAGAAVRGRLRRPS
jgi:hypothetical protein